MKRPEIPNRYNRRSLLCRLNLYAVFVMLLMLQCTAVMGQATDLSRTDGSITLDLYYTDVLTKEKKQLDDGTVTVYKAAGIKAEGADYSFDISAGQFKEVPDFTAEAAALTNDVSNARIAEKLAGYILGKEGKSARISSGSVTVKDLEPALYLMVQTAMPKENVGMNPFLFTIPMEGEYQINAAAKLSIIDNSPGEVVTEKEIPETKTAETDTGIAKPGNLKGKPKTNKERGKPDKDKERDKSEKDNKDKEAEKPEKDKETGKLPQTGQLWWPVPMLVLAGVSLLLLSSVRRKKSR